MIVFCDFIVIIFWMSYYFSQFLVFREVVIREGGVKQVGYYGQNGRKIGFDGIYVYFIMFRGFFCWYICDGIFDEFLRDFSKYKIIIVNKVYCLDIILVVGFLQRYFY